MVPSMLPSTYLFISIDKYYSRTQSNKLLFALNIMNAETMAVQGAKSDDKDWVICPKQDFIPLPAWLRDHRKRVQKELKSKKTGRTMKSYHLDMSVNAVMQLWLHKTTSIWNGYTQVSRHINRQECRDSIGPYPV